MRQSILTMVVLLLLGAFALAGCGGDDDGSATGGGNAGNGTAADAGGGNEGAGSPDGGEAGGGEAQQIEATSESKDEYVAKANALCRKRMRQISADVASLSGDLPANADQEVALRRLVKGVVAPSLEAEAEELRELGAPEGAEQQIEAIVRALEAAVAEARKRPKAFINRSPALAQAQRLAREYGIDACGSAS